MLQQRWFLRCLVAVYGGRSSPSVDCLNWGNRLCLSFTKRDSLLKESGEYWGYWLRSSATGVHCGGGDVRNQGLAGVARGGRVGRPTMGFDHSFTSCLSFNRAAWLNDVHGTPSVRQTVCCPYIQCDVLGAHWVARGVLDGYLRRVWSMESLGNKVAPCFPKAGGLLICEGSHLHVQPAPFGLQ